MPVRFLVVASTYNKEEAEAQLEKLRGVLLSPQIVELAPGDSLVRVSDVRDALAELTAKPRRFEKPITFCGQRAKVACDGRCNKAWGISSRPRVQLSENPDDYAFLSDGELGEAPQHPGTSEGGIMKPLIPITRAEQMNKWCVRECERCSMSLPGEYDKPLELRTFSSRRYNIAPHERPESEGK